jgi:hypothetical protein
MTEKMDEDDFRKAMDVLRSDPMFVREFLEIHEELMRDPWFRVRYFLARWSQKMRRWWCWE